MRTEVASDAATLALNNTRPDWQFGRIGAGPFGEPHSNVSRRRCSAEDNISELAELRRADGSSMYTVAGSELVTSARILAAEQRLVATGGRTDGRVVEAEMVELALLEAAANGNALDAG